MKKLLSIVFPFPKQYYTMCILYVALIYYICKGLEYGLKVRIVEFVIMLLIGLLGYIVDVRRYNKGGIVYMLQPTTKPKQKS